MVRQSGGVGRANLTNQILRKFCGSSHWLHSNWPGFACLVLIEPELGESLVPGLCQSYNISLWFLAMHERERERERDSWYFQCFQSQSSSMAVTPRRALISSEPETKTWCQSLKFALWLETISVDKTGDWLGESRRRELQQSVALPETAKET